MVDPPELEPGYWTGAGDMVIDVDSEEYWLTSRWRGPHEKGASWSSGVRILRSDDGADFEEAVSMHRTELADRFGDDGIVGVEGQGVYGCLDCRWVAGTTSAGHYRGLPTLQAQWTERGDDQPASLNEPAIR